MKRFEFRLERVLKVKQQQQRLAELRQQQARFRVEAATAEVAAVQRQIQELAAALDEELGRASRQHLWLAHCDRSRLLGQALTAAEDRLQQAEQELRQAHARRQQIATEVEALLTLRQQQWQDYRQEVARAQQEQLDDLGMRRWLTGKRNPFAEG